MNEQLEKPQIQQSLPLQKLHLQLSRCRTPIFCNPNKMHIESNNAIKQYFQKRDMWRLSIINHICNAFEMYTNAFGVAAHNVFNTSHGFQIVKIYDAQLHTHFNTNRQDILKLSIELSEWKNSQKENVFKWEDEEKRMLSNYLLIC